ncbi:DUF3244 domain-containing protein [uncultured Lutibacter sp.]|uniref:DUF3244 domain-containing protein n=1 Tax=uncultured Lutibacter sp. TaxID=437739 RepID=UPI00262918EE|nr:DUF3244 domain-containing protein [uncultured Lutibacter sp.]
MKNLFKRSLQVVVLFTLLGSNAMSNDNNPSNNLIVVNGKLVDITLKYNDGDLKININDSFGYVLYNDIYKGASFTRKFDLTSLPNGSYYFEIEGQTRISRIPFNVNSTNVDFLKDEESVFFKPIVRMQDNTILISKITLNNEKLNLELYDEDLNLLYTEELVGDIQLQRGLNISKLMVGEYKLVMNSEKRKFEQKVKKRK